MRNNVYSICCAIFLATTVPAHGQTISTFAGSPVSGYGGDGGPANAASLFHPKGAAADIYGNVYIADAYNNVIRKVDPSGTISTFAGLPAGGYGGDHGPATAAFFNHPNGIAIDHRGNFFICDGDNHAVRKINSAGIITTVAGDGTAGAIGDGGPATAAELNFPGGIAVDDTGNLYIADEYNNEIRKVDTFGIITAFAGSGASGVYSGEGGSATTAVIGFPFGIAVDHSGNVYFSLTLEDRICKVSTTGIITTIAGVGGGAGGYGGDGGPATAADLDNPWGIGTDPLGNVYIADFANERIRKLDRLTGIITTVAGDGTYAFGGDGGPATLARLAGPAGVYIDDGGAMYIADYNNHRIRKVNSSYTHPPSFTGGHSQLLAACTSVLTSVDSLMHIIDADAGQYETWSIAVAPMHGTLSARYGAISTGTTLIPSGLSYKSAIGYTGPDSFKVRVWDGISADTTTVHVTVSGSCGPVLVNALDKPACSVMPNPGYGDFTVNLSSGDNEPLRIVITDIAGREITKMTGQTNKPLFLHIDAPNGVYMLRATSATNKWNEKLVLMQ